MRKSKPGRCFSTIEEEPEFVNRSRSQDDSFVSTKVVVKKRGRPEMAITEEVAAIEESTTKSVPKMRGWPKALAHEGDPHVDDLALAAARAATGIAPLDPVAPGMEPQSLHVPITLVKKRGRPRKKVVDDEEPIDNVESIINAMQEESGQRPRRRAAMTARTKVLDGYKEENSDITKKRRDVLSMHTSRDPVAEEVRVKQHMETQELPRAKRKTVTKPRRRKRAVTNPHASDNGHVETHGAQGPTTVHTKQRTRTTIDAESTSDVGALPSRPKRHAAVAAHVKVLDGFAEEATNVPKRRREDTPVSWKRQPILSSILTLTDTALQRKEDQHSRNKPYPVNGQSVVPAKRPRVEDGAAEIAPTPVSVRQPLAEVEVNIRSISPEKAAINGLAKHAKVRAKLSPRTQAQVIAKVSASKKRRPRSTYVSRDVTAEPAEVPDTSVKQVEMLSGPEGQVSMAAEPKLRLDESATAAPPLPTAKQKDERRSKSSKIKVSRSKAPLNLAQAQEPAPDGRGEDDVDWLLGNVKSTKSRKVPTAKKTSKVDSQLPDMDLNDLLSNIANFVPRGKRHS